ncbi:hypothetical protein LTR84_009484 [Exophiala bonariae]|uniref:CRIB domain-containing protein n=1 Tax=Exophiala bonariae TaxID=1690606 RepID=A0AAV9MX17_9EURO|nr:hypothetical protein LTR84_009484 [Exophiala bonariae]
MNATSEDTRNGRRGNDSKGANQHRSTTSTTSSRDGTPGATQNRRGGKPPQGLNRSTETVVQNGPASPASLPGQDEHVSHVGFNPAAVDTVLKQGYDAKAPVFKPESKTQPTKSESPWGPKRESSTLPSSGQSIDK